MNEEKRHLHIVDSSGQPTVPDIEGQSTISGTSVPDQSLFNRALIQEPHVVYVPSIRGGGGGGGNLEARIAKLESCVEYIQRDITDIKNDIGEIKKTANSDFRQLFGALIFVALGLAALIAKGFNWI